MVSEDVASQYSVDSASFTEECVSDIPDAEFVAVQFGCARESAYTESNHLSSHQLFIKTVMEACTDLMPFIGWPATAQAPEVTQS